VRQVWAIAVDDMNLLVSFVEHLLEDVGKSLPEVRAVLREKLYGLGNHFFESGFRSLRGIGEGQGMLGEFGHLLHHVLDE
jgi:hypothetical protein